MDKACFQHDMAYGDFKDLPKRTAADKVLRDKAFKIASDQKYDGYQRGLASMVYKFLDKKSSESGIVNKENIQLADELHKPIIRKFNKRKVHSSFRDNIWGVDLADMQLLSKFNKGFRFLLCVIDIFGKYAWGVPLKDKKGVSIVNAFQIILKESNREPNKIWVYKGSEIYKYMTSISKNVYIDKLDDIVKKYNNTYHTSIKMTPVDVKDNTYNDFKKEVNDKDLKFKIGDRVRISKYKNIFAKRYMPNWSEEIFITSKIKNTVPWTYVLNDLNGEEIIGTFYEKELQATNQHQFRI